MKDLKELEVGIIFECGASSHKCRCDCPMYCEHVWDGPTLEEDGRVAATCSRCGMDAISHSLWTLP